MEAGLLGALLGVVIVPGDTAIQDLDLQKVSFLSYAGRSGQGGA